MNDNEIDDKDNVSKSLLININNNSDSNNFIIKSDNNLTCAELLSLNPDRHGVLYKHNKSMWSFLLFFLPWLYEKWKKRYFILIGNYLYKFKHDNDEMIRGSPIPLDAVMDLKIITDMSKYDLSNRTGDDINYYFEIITLKKTYILKCDNHDEMMRWINAIKRRKLQSIKESMGHSPINVEIKRVNDIGLKLVMKRLNNNRNHHQHHSDVDGIASVCNEAHNPYTTTY